MGLFKLASWYIDNILIKYNLWTYQTYRLNVSYPDHYPLFEPFNSINNIESDNIKFGKIDYRKLQKTASETNWEILIIY